MTFIAITFVFLFGTVIGSFLNVVIYRYNSGTSPLKGRSQCFACGKTLTWRELVPIFSFLISKGRCAQCGVRLSWQYPIVEILSGSLFVAVFLLGKPLSETIFLLAVFSTLLVIVVYDLRHQIIPDGLAAFFALVSIAWFFWTIPGGAREAFRFPYYWTLIAGPVLFFPFWALWFVSKGRWLGLGDGKLAWGIGWFLGATLGGSAIMLGFWIGAAFALFAMGLQSAKRKFDKLNKFKKFEKSKTKWMNLLNLSTFYNFSNLGMQSEIPFGPFLILGTVIVYFTHVNFFDGSVNLFSFL
ncbi:prepilin peptidase [Candidatus Berkelbacteria bacterium]|nr:prepilin peptidase [Candidatus Berkelbacteria bacterium]